MSSIYTDQEREARYDRLRKKKRFFERVYGVAMIITIFASLYIFGDGAGAFIAGLAGMGLGYALVGVLVILLGAANVVAVYLHRLKLSATVLGLNILFALLGLNGLGGAIEVISMIATVIADIVWQKLSQEEGFPLFEITYGEQQARAKMQDSYVRQRALEAGARADNLGGESNMQDLLDTGNTAQPLPAIPGQYHDRYQGAQAFENNPQASAPGVMTSLETMDNTPIETHPQAEHTYDQPELPPEIVDDLLKPM